MSEPANERANEPAINRSGNTTPRRANQFTIRSILVITLIMAVASAGAGQLWQAMNGKLEDLGTFILVTSMAPLGLMIIVNWIFRLFGKL